MTVTSNSAVREKQMKFSYFTILVLAAMSCDAAEFSSPAVPVAPLAEVPADVIHIPADAAKIKAMAEWDVIQTVAGEQTGQRILIREGTESLFGPAPADASQYEARSHKYPSGAVRILSWDKDSGSVVHQVTFETEIFVLQGEVDMELDDDVIRLNAGDAVSRPAGVLRNMNPTGPTVIVQYFVGNTSEAPKTEVVRGEGLREMHLVQWMEDGEAITAVKEEDIRNAPANGAALSVTRYTFDGNSIRHAKLKKGGTTNPTTYAVDVLIYIIKGHMRRTEGDRVFEVSAGDTVRETEGQTGYWELLEDSEFISTNAPFDPSRPMSSR
jgi:quercetin dioxygenase-like cupin family protein